MQTGPGIVMEVLGLDALAQRREVTKTRTIADVMHAAIKRFTPDLIVIDESHRIKGASSNASRTAARLTRLVPRRLILTGTVMPHSPMDVRSEEHTSELQSLMRNSYAVFCLKKKKQKE